MKNDRKKRRNNSSNIVQTEKCYKMVFNTISTFKVISHETADGKMMPTNLPACDCSGNLTVFIHGNIEISRPDILLHSQKHKCNVWDFILKFICDIANLLFLSTLLNIFIGKIPTIFSCIFINSIEINPWDLCKTSIYYIIHSDDNRWWISCQPGIFFRILYLKKPEHFDLEHIRATFVRANLLFHSSSSSLYLLKFVDRNHQTLCLIFQFHNKKARSFN